MPRNFFHTALFSSVAAMLTMLAPTAHGTAIVRARLDPFAVSGIPVPGYNGYADFEVFPSVTGGPSPCLVGDGWKSVNTSSSCGSVSMFDSVIYLYGDEPGDGPGTSPHLDTLRFESYLSEFSDAIFGIYVAGGQIKGIDMSPVSPFVAPDGVYAGRSFLLSFGTNCGGVGLCPGFNPFGSLADATQPTNGLRTTDITFTSGLPASDRRQSVLPGPTAVPEPGTLSLLFGALGGAWLARRRSKPKQ